MSFRPSTAGALGVLRLVFSAAALGTVLMEYGANGAPVSFDIHPSARTEWDLRVYPSGEPWRSPHDRLAEREPASEMPAGAHVGPVRAGPFLAVRAGSYHTCALRTNGVPLCWGANWAGQADPPPGPFSQIAAGFDHSCGVRPDGEVRCWGANQHGQLDLKIDDAERIEAGHGITCVVRRGGQLACAGATDYESPPGLVFTKIEIAGDRAFGLTRSGRVIPAGDQGGTVFADDLRVADFSLGQTACILKLDGRLRCVYAGYPSGLFQSVTGGEGATCGFRLGGALECWGGHDLGLDRPPADDLVSVSVGAGHACGLRSDGAVRCWGLNVLEQTGPDVGELEFMGLDASSGVLAVRDREGFVWSWATRGEAARRSRQRYRVVTAVDTAARCVCGITEHGRGHCCRASLKSFGEDIVALAALEPDEPLDEIYSHCDHTINDLMICGLRRSGRVVCLGDLHPSAGGPCGRVESSSGYPVDALAYHGDPECPRRAHPEWAKATEGVFTEITSGGDQFCALGAAGTVCWDSGYRVLRPYDAAGRELTHEPFAQVSLGRGRGCGVRHDGSVRCWKAGECVGECALEPPSGTHFARVSSGDHHSCGITISGELRCWGENAQQQTAAPEGKFTQLVTAHDYNCALRLDGQVLCWGALSHQISQQRYGG